MRSALKTRGRIKQWIICLRKKPHTGIWSTVSIVYAILWNGDDNLICPTPIWICIYKKATFASLIALGQHFG